MTPANPTVPRLAESPRQLGRQLRGLFSFAAVQAVVQAIGFLVGLLVVRTLSVGDYAYYTLAVSMVGISQELLLLGLANAVLAQGGAQLGNTVGMARLMADAFALHKRSALLLVPLLSLAFAAMFSYHRASALQVAVLTALVALCALLQVRNSLSLAVVRLHGERVFQQKLDFSVNVGRALAVATLVLLGLNASSAVFVNVMAAAAICVCLHLWFAGRLGPLPVADGSFRPALLALVKRQAPNSIFYCFSGQATIWLVGLLGSTQTVAEVGALGRIAVLFTIIGAVVVAIIQPYFARQHEARALVRAFAAVNAFFAVLTLALWALASAYPGYVLWILGGSYRSLQAAVPWLVLGACLAAWSGAAYAIGAARGWVVSAAWLIPSGLLAIVASIALFDVATPTGACMMGCVTAGTGALVSVGYVSQQLRAALRAHHSA